ncbi:MAG: hypothetical protein NTX15_04595 [Candidatus Kapabacteria bacterium]|nr:hypothetical protein [Candidatus Kapabacteria bacterium]
MKKPLLIAAMLMLTTSGVWSQQYFGSVYWSVATPTGQFRSFVNETSVAGFGLDVQWWASDHVSAGLVLGYNVWSDVYRGVTQQYKINDLQGAVNGTQVHTVNSFTLMAGGRYLFGGSRDVRPFFGLAAGAVTSAQALEVSLVRFTETNWHLGVAPSVGLLIPMSFNSMLDLSARFSYGFPSGQALYNVSQNTISFWSINAGFTFGN